MRYLDRTLQVKEAVLSQPETLQRLRDIFSSHLNGGGIKPDGVGNSRLVYKVAPLDLTVGQSVSLLIKLKRNFDRMTYAQSASSSQFGDWEEFGAFETYYDFVAGQISEVSFRTQAGYEQYCSCSTTRKRVASSFSLAEPWGGTMVSKGDLGALPYFQMAVRFGQWFGQLTEGEPPLIEPQGSAEDYGTWDDYTVERWRIIDLSPHQCQLIYLDRGRSYLPFGQPHPSHLGVHSRGEKYFDPVNQLNL